jgi:hypothetical protein
LEAGVVDADVMSVIWLFLAADQCRRSSLEKVKPERTLLEHFTTY